jgi:hypothetical protein
VQEELREKPTGTVLLAHKMSHDCCIHIGPRKTHKNSQDSPDDEKLVVVSASPPVNSWKVLNAN